MLNVGTYSVRGSAGIYRLSFDRQSGALALVDTVAGLKNPSFLALHPAGRHLYAVCEHAQAGAVATVALEVGLRASQVLGQESTGGAGPCHVAVAPGGQWLATANYGSGSVSIHALNADGTVGAASDVAQHCGSGPSASRQQGPHAHSANFDPSGRFLIAPDLGLDRLMVYDLQTAPGKLTPTGAVAVQAGAGPRHLAFHPSGRWAYLINELDNTIVGYRWDGAGGLQPLQTVTTLPAGFSGESYCADIHVHPSGKVLYGSNRGHDSLAIFRLDPASGLLETAGMVATGGKHPRNFTLTADGRWLLVGNMHSDTIVVFEVGDEGGLEVVGDAFALPSPACLLFGPET